MSLKSTARHALVLASVATLIAAGLCPSPLMAQEAPRDLSVTADLKGRTVEGVKVIGNHEVVTASILNVVRTREGDKFDPATVQEDYQRIFGLRRFSNVEAKVEPTATGVIVIFQVTEQKQLKDIIIKKQPSGMDEQSIRNAIDLQPGQAIDPFRIAQARRAILDLYQGHNYPLASVNIDMDQVNKTGVLTIHIVEGPQVRIRNIAFIGNKSFSDYKLKDQIRSRSWIFILRDGAYSPEVVEDDVGALRKFYQDKVFFDVRVGRKLIWSPDQTEMQIDFVIDEGPRYTIDKVTFKGNSNVTEATLRENLKDTEGRPYDKDLIDRDIRKIVRDYSPLGYVYQPGSKDPNYLKIDTKPIYKLEPGHVELVYEITEGTPFRIGQILPRGNSRTQDKVILRELRMAPGELYNSGKVQDAMERLRGTPYFSSVKITPVGDEPDERDLLVEVEEARTATLTFGAGINSNGGIAGNVTYTQKNFDITNWPRSLSDIGGDKAFVGAGQTLRLSFEPGTTTTNASIRFTEPWVLDQPYSLTTELYLRNFQREVYDDDRIGGFVSVGHRFSDIYSGSVGLRAEDIDIRHIQDKPVRAFEILQEQGTHALTSMTLSVRRDTTTGGLLPSKGTNTQLSWESVGVFGGDYTFQRLQLAHDEYFTLGEDLLDRKTILALHGDAGYIIGSAPFFERFYGGGINSIRGFAFRGVTPRSGPEDDRVGGKFSLTGTAEVSYPLYEDLLRGVVFTDVGTIEPSLELGTIRSAVGTGIRLTLPFLGQIPIAIDFALPVTKDSKDSTQVISFSLGFTP
ncbi:MAG: outer membrane protein assembly factor BamA [Tepidisphaeraceae bacterium]